MSTEVQDKPDVFECFRGNKDGVRRCFGELMRASLDRIHVQHGESFESLANLWGVEEDLLDRIHKGDYSRVDKKALDHLLDPLEVPFTACAGLLDFQNGLMAKWLKAAEEQQFMILAATGRAEHNLDISDENGARLFVLLQAVQKL